MILEAQVSDRPVFATVKECRIWRKEGLILQVEGVYPRHRVDVYGLSTKCRLTYGVPGVPDYSPIMTEIPVQGILFHLATGLSADVFGWMIKLVQDCTDFPDFPDEQPQDVYRAIPPNGFPAPEGKTQFLTVLSNRELHQYVFALQSKLDRIIEEEIKVRGTWTPGDE